MKFKEVSGLKLPAIGMGTLGMGIYHEKQVSEIDVIRTSIKLGMTHIDTAEMYGWGKAEEIVGKSIKPFARRKLFITTKVWKDNLREKDLINSATNSLKRLNTDYVDLYLIHWPNPKIPLRETMKAMNKLIDEELVKNIGVSNFPVHLLKKAREYSKHSIIANQIEYNIFDRPDKNLIEYCERNNIIIIAYRPVRPFTLGFSIKIVDDLAEKYDKTPVQIGLNWLLSKNNVVAIPKSMNINHIKENIDSLKFSIDEKDVKLLDAVKPPVRYTARRNYLKCRKSLMTNIISPVYRKFFK